MVIDDDPYGLLRFAGEPLPTLRELGAGEPLVFSVRTFSKIVAPGLRVGWVDTVPELQPLLINAKQAMDTCTNLPAQRLLAGFLTGGHLENHLVTQRAEYKRRKEAMHTALQEHFGDIARWTDPEGGFFLWVTLDDGTDTNELFDTALAEGVAFIPGAAFSPARRFTDALRLCFASTPPDRIHEGVARLRRAVNLLAKG
jgi:2-aminoadipate transaminase